MISQIAFDLIYNNGNSMNDKNRLLLSNSISSQTEHQKPILSDEKNRQLIEENKQYNVKKDYYQKMVGKDYKIKSIEKNVKLTQKDIDNDMLKYSKHDGKGNRIQNTKFSINLQRDKRDYLTTIEVANEFENSVNNTLELEWKSDGLSLDSNQDIQDNDNENDNEVENGDKLIEWKDEYDNLMEEQKKMMNDKKTGLMKKNRLRGFLGKKLEMDANIDKDFEWDERNYDFDKSVGFFGDDMYYLPDLKKNNDKNRFDRNDRKNLKRLEREKKKQKKLDLFKNVFIAKKTGMTIADVSAYNIAHNMASGNGNVRVCQNIDGTSDEIFDTKLAQAMIDVTKSLPPKYRPRLVRKKLKNDRRAARIKAHQSQNENETDVE